MVRTTLDNGMRVVIDDVGAADAAAVYIWINAGSSSESPGLEGAAHFLEHMVFKGTASYGVGGVAAAIEDLGGDLNAYTAFDETVFHATVPGAAAPAAMAVLAEMLRTARFDADELERERQVILEEIRGGQDEPELVLSEAAWARGFPGHPYGRSVIGTVESVRAIPREALKAFYEARYQPANTCLAVVGRVDAAAVEAAARRLFSGGGPAGAPRVDPPARPGAGHEVLRCGFEALMVRIGFPGPGHGHPDAAALDVICTALGGGPSSPLEARMRIREALCLDVDMQYEAEITAGMATVSFHARDGRADAALAAAREELAKARAGGLLPGDIERAKAQIVADRVFGRETVDGRAHGLLFDIERMGDPEAWRAYEAAVLAVTPAEATRVAAKWLAPEREVAVAMVPEGEGITLEAAPGPVSAPRASRPVVASLHVLDNGIRVLLDPDDGEVAAVRIAGLGGQLAESRRTAGRASAWARAVVRGTAELDSVAFSAEVELLSGGIGASASRSTQWLRGEFIARNLMPGLDLLTEALLRPAFSAEEVGRVREEMLVAIDEREDFPEQLASERMWALACGAHAYGVPPLGTEATVSRLGSSDVAAYHARWLRSENLVVAVSGAFDPERVLRRLRRVLGGIPSGFRRPESAPLRHPETTRRQTLRCGREQAHLLLAWPGVRVHDPEEPDVEVLAAVLGGQGGRLFLELREEHGLAYSVSAASHEGVDPGLLVCAIATDPARAAEAERRLLASVARLATDGVSEAEVSRVKSYLLGGAEMELQTAGARASAAALAELYGLGGLGYRGLVRRRIAPVTAASLHARAAAMLARPLAIVAVMPG